MIWQIGDDKPEIDPDAWIAPSAQVIGRVRLAPGVGIWFGAVLRGDIELIDIGDSTNIQDNTVLHTDRGYPLTIGEKCVVGHRAVLHGCTIGDGTLVGMGAMILNGARIGRGCVIGAKTLITQDKEIPDNSLVVGAPCEILREVGESTRVEIEELAEFYRLNAARFRDGLKPLGGQ